MPNFNLPNYDEWLSPAEIKARLDKFNENEDWSVFDDVPESQHVSIMYPHYIKMIPDEEIRRHRESQNT